MPLRLIYSTVGLIGRISVCLAQAAAAAMASSLFAVIFFILLTAALARAVPQQPVKHVSSDGRRTHLKSGTGVYVKQSHGSRGLRQTENKIDGGTILTAEWLCTLSHISFADFDASHLIN